MLPQPPHHPTFPDDWYQRHLELEQFAAGLDTDPAPLSLAGWWVTLLCFGASAWLALATFTYWVMR